LEASTRIPFPTGTTIKGISVSSNPTEADEAITVLSSLYEQIKNNHFDSIENVYAFARALKVINKNIDANNNIVISSGVGNI
jgi:hypothetical protein